MTKVYTLIFLLMLFEFTTGRYIKTNASVNDMDFSTALSKGFQLIRQESPNAKLYSVSAVGFDAQPIMTLHDAVDIGIEFKIGNEEWTLDSDQDELGEWQTPRKEAFEVKYDGIFKPTSLVIGPDEALFLVRETRRRDPLNLFHIFYTEVEHIMGKRLVHAFNFQPLGGDDYDIYVDTLNGEIYLETREKPQTSRRKRALRI